MIGNRTNYPSMKNKILLLFLLIGIFCTIQSQEKINKAYITGNINFTFALNENYVLFEPDDDEYMLNFSAIFLRAGFGHRFNNLWSAGVNLGFDHHTNFGIKAIPTYGTVRYNISEDGYDAFYTEVGYGKLWRLNKHLKNGAYYKIGLGVDFGGSGRWGTSLKLDFHRKKISGFRNGNLDSVSLGIGFSFM